MFVCLCVCVSISLFFLLSSLSIVLQYACFQALDLKFNFCQVGHNIIIISMILLSFSLFHHLFPLYLYAGCDSSDKGENDW